MTDQSLPVEPTDSVLAEVASAAIEVYPRVTELPYFLDPDSSEYEPVLLALRAVYRFGSDQELIACVELANEMLQDGNSLRAARRPQPPITRREAISVLDDIDCLFDLPSGHYNTLLRALETLPND